MNNLFDLTGKTIVFTAAYSRLAKAMVEALLEYGATVYITGRDEKKLEAFRTELELCFGSRVRRLALDATDDNSIKNCFTTVLALEGKIDVLVNSISFSKAGRLHEIEFSDFSYSIDGTINANFKVTQEALKMMVKQNYGNIINIASMYGVVSPDPSIYGDMLPNPAGYGCGKAAIISLTRYIACNYGHNNIRANCISPGAFPGEAASENKQFIKMLEKKNPLGRIGNPLELKGAIVFLASDSASYMTGQNISIDGGWTAW